MNETPTYNLKAVLKQTGLRADTLRAWERSYGLPQPQRSPGGHRLYSSRDIEIIAWLKARQGEGLSISKAVDLWHSLESEGRDPLTMSAYAEPAAPAAPVARVTLIEGNSLLELRDAWLSACRAFDERGAEQVLSEAFGLYPLEAVCLQILLDGLREIGAGWYEGRVSVEQEHFASELAMRRLEALVAAAPPPVRAGRILVGAPPDEEHDFVPLLITLLLRRQGWDVLYLGANVPAASFETLTATAEIQLVVVSAQQFFTAANLLEVAKVINKNGVHLAFGGRIFSVLPDLPGRVPGYYLGDRLEAAPQIVEQIMAGSLPVPQFQAPSEEYQEAFDHYSQRLPLIGIHVWELLEGKISSEILSLANFYLARDIAAALAFGDMSLAGGEMAWVKDLLISRGVPKSQLPGYLDAYREALSSNLDERGRTIIAWFDQFSA
jgi:DNA-binding transcriptional MerR regulator/methylmalonyl-CoA mutase cobalamin-binding subunit